MKKLLSIIIILVGIVVFGNKSLASINEEKIGFVESKTELINLIINEYGNDKDKELFIDEDLKMIK